MPGWSGLRRAMSEVDYRNPWDVVHCAQRTDCSWDGVIDYMTLCGVTYSMHVSQGMVEKGQMPTCLLCVIASSVASTTTPSPST